MFLPVPSLLVVAASSMPSWKTDAYRISQSFRRRSNGSKPQYCKGQSFREGGIAFVNFVDQLSDRHPTEFPGNLSPHSKVNA